uniref:Uncharacterized protein n=1 Tax=Picea sitchensis TaxID=3332 RepID=A0A6B9XUT0_PICSI|nr:hypothetical protein Q903MT_gene4104 [Picea sitchensis]
MLLKLVLLLPLSLPLMVTDTPCTPLIGTHANLGATLHIMKKLPFTALTSVPTLPIPLVFWSSGKVIFYSSSASTCIYCKTGA